MTIKAINKFFSKYSDYSLISLRIGVGFIFLVHGIGKLLAWGPFASGISRTSDFFAGLGIPLPMLAAWIVALVETFGGLFLILGFLTRPAALLLSINMIIALLTAHLPNGFYGGKSEFPFLLLMGAITLLLAGAGEKLKLDKD